MHEMDCREAVEKMGEFLDRELSGDEKAKVEQHLEECGGCKHAFRWEDSILRLVKECAQVEAPEGLMEKLMKGCDQE